MRTTSFLILVSSALAGCSTDVDRGLPELALDDAKADGSAPTAKLPLRWHEDELETIHPIAFERLVIGVGQYQHDLDEAKLSRSLDAVSRIVSTPSVSMPTRPRRRCWRASPASATASHRTSSGIARCTAGSRRGRR